jgi:glutamyl-tRNA synthetase
MPLVQKRIKKLSDIMPLVDFCFSGDVDHAAIAGQLAIPDVAPAAVAAGLLDFVERFEAREGWSAATLEEVAKAWTADRGWSTRDAYGVLRVAITGRASSPPLFESMEILGKEIARRRLRQAAEVLGKAP